MPSGTHVLPTALRPFVASAQGYRVPAFPAGVHRGLPSRHLTLVVELVEPLRVRGERGRVAAHGVLGGIHTRPVTIDASGPQEGLQYALTPLGAEAVLGVPASDVAEVVLDLVDVLGPQGRRLVEQLHEARGWRERFDLVDTALLRRVASVAPHVPAEVTEAWRLTFATAGRLRVQAIADHVGWSRRHLAERFAGATGVTPKQAARIARFEAVRRHLLGPRDVALAQIAVVCGYSDQSHLAREWRELAGCSVSTWLREELPFVQDARPAEEPE